MVSLRRRVELSTVGLNVFLLNAAGDTANAVPYEPQRLEI